MGTIIDKVLHLANVKDDLEAAFIEQGQNPTDVIATYPDIVRNMETSIDGESVITELNEQTATADELVAIAKRKYFETLNTGIYVWKKLTAEGGDFIEYVVSGESTTYPDGGEQDGYWYELFDPETLLPANIRKDVDVWGVVGTLSEDELAKVFTKNAHDIFTLASNVALVSYTVTIPHSLGVIPKLVIIKGRDGNFEGTVTNDGISTGATLSFYLVYNGNKKFGWASGGCWADKVEFGDHDNFSGYRIMSGEYDVFTYA